MEHSVQTLIQLHIQADLMEYIVEIKNCFKPVDNTRLNVLQHKNNNNLKTTFLDIDECAVNNGGCSHDCTNALGSYICTCPDAELSLADDKHSCEGKMFQSTQSIFNQSFFVLQQQRKY